MAPTPVNEGLTADPTSTAKPSKYWTNTNIALTAVFALLALAIIIGGLVFFLHRRAEKKKLDQRKSDKDGLLANEDKTNMFSQVRHTSVTLYVDSDGEPHSKRVSSENASLVPLRVTPANESRDPLSIHTESTGSSVSAMSRATNTNTLSTILLSPVSPTGEEGDLGIRPMNRSRSASTTSQKARYYESVPTNMDLPPIPKIIRTPSDGEIR